MGKLTLNQYKQVTKLLNYPITCDRFDCSRLCKVINNVTYPLCCYMDDTIKNIIELHTIEKPFLEVDGKWLRWATKINYVYCAGYKKCQRDKRPLECMMFPITPLIRWGNVVGWTFHPDYKHTCGLQNRFDLISKTYLKRAKIAWEILLTDTRFRKKVEGWQKGYANSPKIAA